MPKHEGGGVTSFGNRVDTENPKAKVSGARPSGGPKGRPRSGRPVSSNPQAAAKAGMDQAKNPGQHNI